MGREIRRVPPNWEHPKRGNGSYIELFNSDVETVFAEWMEEYRRWVEMEHDRVIQEYGEEKYPKDQPYRSFCAWFGSPSPDPKSYHPKWADGEATWYQVYETVSEGTPVTPPFATQAELVDYLVENGDFWDQSRRRRGLDDSAPWSRRQAEAFVYGDGWAPSFVVARTESGRYSGSGVGFIGLQEEKRHSDGGGT